MTIAAIKSGLFTEGPQPALVGGRCGSCDRLHFPKTEICPYCSGNQVEQVELSRTGTLWAWTSVRTAPPGYSGDVPYGFGVVELPEGLRVVTRLTDADPETLQLGQMMRLELVPVRIDEENEGLTYAFSADSSADFAHSSVDFDEAGG